jgi:hypothetical protein
MMSGYNSIIRMAHEIREYLDKDDIPSQCKVNEILDVANESIKNKDINTEMLEKSLTVQSKKYYDLMDEYEAFKKRVPKEYVVNYKRQSDLRCCGTCECREGDYQAVSCSKHNDISCIYIDGICDDYEKRYDQGEI